jgi:hypothetical protein
VHHLVVERAAAEGMRMTDDAEDPAIMARRLFHYGFEIAHRTADEEPFGSRRTK